MSNNTRCNLAKGPNGKLFHTIDQDKLHEFTHTFKVGSILNVSDHTFTRGSYEVRKNR